MDEKQRQPEHYYKQSKRRCIIKSRELGKVTLGFSYFIIQYKTALYKMHDLCYNKITTIMGAL